MIKSCLISFILLMNVINLTAQNSEDRVTEEFLHATLLHLDTAIDQTQSRSEIYKLKLKHIDYAKLDLKAYCRKNNCVEFKNRFAEMEKRAIQREKDIKDNNFYNHKLKKEVDSTLSVLEESLKEITTRRDIDIYQYKINRISTKHKFGVLNNTKMEPWTTESTNRLNTLIKDYKDKKAYMELHVPKFGNGNTSLLFGYKFTKHELKGIYKAKYKSILKKEKLIKNKLDVAREKNQDKKIEKLDHKLKGVRLDKHFLLRRNIYDVDNVNMLIYSADKYMSEGKTYGIQSADTINSLHSPYHYIVTPTITHNKMNSEIKVLVNFKRIPTTIAGERIPAAEMFYSWKIKTVPADNEKNVKYILEMDYNNEISVLDYEGNGIYLVYTLDMEAIKQNIIKQLENRFEYEIK